MIRFYPLNLEMFHNGDFDFSPIVSLVAGAKCNYKEFYTRVELIGYLKSRGVKLNDAKFPLEFYDYREHQIFGWGYSVKQWSNLGFMVEYAH